MADLMGDDGFPGLRRVGLETNPAQQGVCPLLCWWTWVVSSMTCDGGAEGLRPHEAKPREDLLPYALWPTLKLFGSG